MKPSHVLAFGLAAACAAAVVPALAGDASGRAHPLATSKTCKLSTACFTYSNMSAGAGLEGNSSNGDGLIGTTAYNGSGTSAAYGVEGEDNALSSTANAGVYGISKNGVGVAGVSNVGLGVNGFSTTGTGVQGISSGGTGVRAESDDPSTSASALYIVSGSSSYLVRAHQGGCNCDKMSLDSGGNMILAGTVTQNGQPQILTHTASAHTVLAYAPRQTQPTIEDTGEATLVNGEARVRLDPAFADAIDKRSAYLAFVTPEGETNGVYVTGKTGEGFVVKENHDGRSTVPIEYRIVAKPFDTNAARLPRTR